MVAVSTDQGMVEVPEPLVAAVVRSAERCALLTAAVLDGTGLFLEKPVQLPAAFLLELSAVLQLGVWERQGLSDYLSPTLLTFAEAAKQLAERARKGLAEFEGPQAAPLAKQVFQEFVQRFAWEGRSLLGADVVVADVDDEDALADALAEFLWQHRQELAHTLTSESREIR